eukprot:NODE_465_length_8145_cov_0.434999.p6 type:complete len:160 gc:universal NODE_465_length_8145_cov_0.434999:2814-2335(-)
MKHHTIYKLIGIVFLPVLSYVSYHSTEVAIQMTLIMGIPLLIFIIWNNLSHSKFPIYLLGNSNLKKEILDDIIYNEKSLHPNGDVEYDLMFCQLINVKEDTGYFDQVHSYYFYRDVIPPNSYKGKVIVDDVMKVRHELPNLHLCTMMDFWTHLKSQGKF